MSSWLILAIAFVYLGIAIDLFTKGQVSMSITFIGFCLGNFGLYLQT